jgi:galactosylceramidase
MASAQWGRGAQSVDLSAGPANRVFDGVGAVSGGGATSVLLKDYPKTQRDQILDILFKPNFAASMQTLYVEVGGDCNATQGSEASHMHARNDENYFRGYEWWLMEEAHRRNPALTLDACAWGCPGWIGDGNFWSQDMCDYYVRWIKGLKRDHGLELSAIGCRNERGAVTPWVKTFRDTLDREGLTQLPIHGFDSPGGKSMWDWTRDLDKDDALRRAVAILGNHCLSLEPKNPEVLARADRYGKRIWNTEEHVYDGDGRRYADEYACALGAVHLFNLNFINSHATKIVNWYLVGSTYPIEPYADQPPALIANQPWSGHYHVKPIVWAYSHYGQFTKIGWKYVESGCLPLDGGGSVVSMRSPDGTDETVIAETEGAKADQELTVKVSPATSGKTWCVWKTTKAAQFIRQPDLQPKDGVLTLPLDPNAIYSVSTLTGQQKGEFNDIPKSAPFPFPYADNFKSYGDPKSWGYLPHYTADICGVFELAGRPDKRGTCLRQVIGKKTESWAPEWMPYTILGDAAWTDYEVTADLYLDNGGWAGLMGRVTQTGNGWDGNPAGYYARLYQDGGVALYCADPKLRGSRDRQLAVGSTENWKWGKWHTATLRFEGPKISLLIDGTPTLSANDTTHPQGMAGLITGGEGTARNTACFDNLTINHVGGGKVEQTPYPAAGAPMYQR